jgi:hypothetical protein
MRGISLVAQDVLASQEGLCSIESVSIYIYISNGKNKFTLEHNIKAWWEVEV